MTESPWLNAKAAGAYLGRSKRFILAEITAGRLRAARIGGKREVLTRREWLDQFIEDQAAPIPAAMRRRA
jgi:excisionase family DNA binding protein